MVVPIAGNQVPTEILSHIFSFCPATDDVKNTQVCKAWQPVAGHVAKQQFAVEKMADIASKAVDYEQLTRDCPVPFARLQEVIDNPENYSIKDAYDIAESATEKHTVCVAQFLRIHPNCLHIPDEKKDDLAGRVFVELRYKKEKEVDIWFNPYWRDKPYYPSLWYSHTVKELKNVSTPIYFFPIEFFDLAVTGDEHTVEGNKDSGGVCFSLKGHLIEWIIEKPEENFCGSHFFGIGGMNRETAFTIDQLGHLCTQFFYVVKDDAAEKKEA